MRHLIREFLMHVYCGVHIFSVHIIMVGKVGCEKLRMELTQQNGNRMSRLRLPLGQANNSRYPETINIADLLTDIEDTFSSFNVNVAT
jgi:hypothetical protein